MTNAITIIDVSTAEVDALLGKLQQQVGPGMRAVLQHLGDEMVARIKGRFATATDPDGKAWTVNSPVTKLLYLEAMNKSGRVYKKNGDLSKYGAALEANKKPLQGITRALATGIFANAPDSQTLQVGAPLIYARIQQLGGQAGRNKKVTLPPRRYIPLEPDGKTMSPAEQAFLMAEIEREIKKSIEA
jgi:phage gpG-like protein